MPGSELNMKINGKAYRTIWLAPDGWSVEIIDQTRLPHELVVIPLKSAEDAARAILTMQVRGAPLIGATAAYGLAMAIREDASDEAIDRAIELLAKQRPTAINLRWALEEMRRAVQNLPREERVAAAYKRAAEICDEDVETCRLIGEHGRKLIEDIAARKKPGEKVEVLTHCNAGWLACVDWGTATSPIYQAHDAGMPLHVWVDETRPRNQGAALTAFELGTPRRAAHHRRRQRRRPPDAARQVDLVIVGTDRVAANGDVANKIGTYLKALAAHDNGVPFYVALPHSTIDWTLDEGCAIPIEERSADEVLKMPGRLPDGTVVTVEIAAPGSPAGNPAFDVTPARLVTGFITERGVCPATREGLLSLYPERGRRNSVRAAASNLYESRKRSCGRRADAW